MVLQDGLVIPAYLVTQAYLALVVYQAGLVITVKTAHQVIPA